MMYFTADLHIWHEDILLFCRRPFGDLLEMHEVLVDNYNATVKDEDDVFFIGDMTGPEFMRKKMFKHLPNFVNKLKGRKHLILGNHDEWEPFKYVNTGFVSVHTSLWFKHYVEGKGDVEFILSHDPAVATVLNPSQILLCGHIHNIFRIQNKTLPLPTLFNVGVDVNHFTPISIDQIVKELFFEEEE